MEWYNKKDVQKNVQDRGKHQKIKRCFYCRPAHEAYWRSYYKKQWRPFREERQTCNRKLRRKYPPESASSGESGEPAGSRSESGQWIKIILSSVDTAHFCAYLFVLCTTPLAKADTESTGKAIDKAKDKIDNDTGGTNCCKGISTKRFADDHRVSKCIKS